MVWLHWVAAFAVLPLEAGLPDSEDTPNFRSSREGGRKRDTTYQKTHVRKRFRGRSLGTANPQTMEG